MTQYQVVITDIIADQLEPERRLLGDLAEITALDAYDESELIGKIDNADALMVYHNISLSEQSLRVLQKCRVIARGGVGTDNIDLQYARERNIPVVNVPDYGTEEVADSAMGMALALTRGIQLCNSILRDKAGLTNTSQHATQAGQLLWTYEQTAPLQRLRGSTFGIVGLGRIGTATAIRAKSLGFDVAYYDPFKPDGYDKSLGIRRVEQFDQLLAESYVLSLHCPATELTRGMINAETVPLMPKGSYLINTARGVIVETSVIPDAIARGQLAGAAIDVLPQEPPAEDDPLIAAWRDPDHPAYHRLIINPHSAFYCEQGLLEIREKASRACRQALLGDDLRNVVN